MTFNPFEPVPQNKKDISRNVYDDILNPDKEKTPSAPETKFDSKPQFSTPPPEKVEAIKNSLPINSTEELTVDNTEETIHKSRKKADRQRSVSERGSSPKIKDRVDNSPNRKFRFLIAAIIVTALIIGGGAGYGIFYALTNKSEVGSDGNAAALNDTKIDGLSGVSAQKILDSGRVESVTKELDSEAQDFISKIDFLSEPVVGESKAISIQDANGKDTPVFVAVSQSYVYIGDITADQKQKIIDIANSNLVDKGYSAYDINSAGSEDPLNQPQLFIGGARTGDDGSLKSYNITINTSNGDAAVGKSGVFISFYSSPHIKEGTEEEFKKFVFNYYNAAK